MTKYLLSLIILAVVFFNSNAFAQGSFNIHGGLVMPTSDWGDDDLDDEDSGLQGTGFNLGIEGIIPLTDEGLGLFIGGDFNLTSYKKDVKDDIDDMMEEFYVGEGLYLDNPDLKYPKAFVIPISAGLHYAYKPNDKIGLYGKGGIAFSFLKYTDFSFDGEITDGYDSYDFSSTTSFEMANSIGLILGGGVILNDKITLGLSYFGLGEHKVKGEVEVKVDGDSDTQDLDSAKQKVSFVTLTVGIKL